MQREIRAAIRARCAQHDDRPRRLAHDVAERLHAVELRHLDVERDDVRIERVDLPQRVESVARRTHHAKVGRRIHDLADQSPHEGAVVHDEDGRHRVR